MTVQKSFRSAKLDRDYSYSLYLPPSYEKDKAKRYPVVYWLHGGRGNPQDCWKFVEVIDGAVKAGNAPEMIVIGVDGRGDKGKNSLGSCFMDSKDGTLPIETVIVQELIPHVDKTYRTLATRESRAIEGFSMGGGGALRLAFKNPQVFGAVTALGPALIKPDSGVKLVDKVYKEGPFQGDETYWKAHDPLHLAKANVDAIRGKMTIRLASGEKEGSFTATRTKELHDLLDSLKIAHEFVRPDTGHNFVKYYEGLSDSYKFYAKIFAK